MNKFKIGDKVVLTGGYGLASSDLTKIGIVPEVTELTVTSVNHQRYHFRELPLSVCTSHYPGYNGISESGITLVRKGTTYPNPPHKHAELIKAWADGAEIQYKSNALGKWINSKSPMWGETAKYRIKPQPTPQELEIGKIEEEMRKLADRVKELKNG